MATRMAGDRWKRDIPDCVNFLSQTSTEPFVDQKCKLHNIGFVSVIDKISSPYQRYGIQLVIAKG